ncbi:putative ABC transport system ATP-binding protein [Spinactinospora alkalitolerans]|uniref:Putative ABC transport system ATP-binding protein n=1 Tax=Spinactinospora alkalitolerans TaxID=687207 RepID=A0A852TN51_9ACTN|nr:ABC transporter ATP-binding protein [Spinactinospora alkalitolerans]NYE45368.1 putative ABC transport system ATP-binding protein [Spinactinospora alkalitolerans]
MSLALTDVTLTYPDGETSVTALDDVSLRVAPGELAAVVGPSGSGKSSLLAVAATLIRPASGTVQVGGVDVAGLSAAELTRLRLNRIGVVFQQPNLIGSLTAVEQLLVTEHMRGRSPRASRAAAAKTLATVGLDGRQHRRPHQLSGGERQRVNIARALAGDPGVLLVDEPTAALDHDRGAQIIELIVEVTRTFRLATVLVTHDTEFLGAADAVVEMRDGRLAPAPTAARG